MTPRDFAAKDGFVRQAKLVALEEETEAIHFANMLYWNYDAHSEPIWNISGDKNA